MDAFEPLPVTPAPTTSAASEHSTDDQLVRRLKAGDADAFDDLVRSVGGRLLAAARRLVGDEDAARDVVQTAFLSAFRAMQTFDGKSQLTTWLLEARWTALLDVLAAGAAGALTSELACPIRAPVYILLWHVMPSSPARPWRGRWHRPMGATALGRVDERAIAHATRQRVSSLADRADSRRYAPVHVPGVYCRREAPCCSGASSQPYASFLWRRLCRRGRDRRMTRAAG